jgi:UPF0271 protein
MSRTGTIDLNADVGEGCGFDAELVPLVSSVNIACGAHAGDRDTMRRAVELAMGHGVAIGAHPGFADRENFGRRELSINPAAAAGLVIGQARMLQEIAAGMGARLGHIKLHGALYNMAARDRALADAIAEAISGEGRQSGSRWVLVALAGSVLACVAAERGLEVVGEAFADRTYRGDGTLTPRSEAGALIENMSDAVIQAVRIARDGVVASREGSEVRVDAGTLCIHGDSPTSPELARRVRDGLKAAGIAIMRSEGR